MRKGPRRTLEPKLGECCNVLGEFPGFADIIPRVWCPPTDVYETPDAWVIRMEVAGVRKEDLNITVEAGALFVRGKRAEVTKDCKECYHRMEIRYGEFSHRIPLPADIAPEDTDAKLQDGILEVRIPRGRERTRKARSEEPASEVS